MAPQLFAVPPGPVDRDVYVKFVEVAQSAGASEALKYASRAMPVDFCPSARALCAIWAGRYELRQPDARPVLL